MREAQARSCPQVHGEHGASAHQEFEERLLGWAHAQVAHRSFYEGREFTNDVWEQGSFEVCYTAYMGDILHSDSRGLFCPN